MATSLIGGLIANDFDAGQVTACDINNEQLDKLARDFSVNTSSDSIASAAEADIVMLAVKPQVMQVICEQLAALQNQSEQLFISIAAGVREADINRWLGGSRAVVRCMPNTPSLIQLGATGLYANPQVSSTQKANRPVDTRRSWYNCMGRGGNRARRRHRDLRQRPGLFLLFYRITTTGRQRTRPR